MSWVLRPRLRVTTEDGTIVLGPGKADLLDAIARSGSIRAAATELGMSYMRAWTLVRTMNAACSSPLVEKERGGTEGGRARLTDRGVAALQLYREMEEAAREAVEPIWQKLRERL
jgi:molybdate transport system regulatory protein